MGLTTLTCTKHRLHARSLPEAENDPPLAVESLMR